MKKGKYGYNGIICGVYLITCKINGFRYVGSSVHVLNRFSNHMYREAMLYPDKDFYQDVRAYTWKGFEFEILEKCEKDQLIEREQYYYDMIQPEYNMFRPVENVFKDPLYREYIEDRYRNNTELHAKRKKLYNTPEYKEKFRTCHTEKMRTVDMFTLDGDYIRSFISIRDTARWLDENTDYKAKNKTSKVKAVCDKERKTAFGYIFQYSKKNVETISKESTSVIDTQVEAVGLSKDNKK